MNTYWVEATCPWCFLHKRYSEKQHAHNHIRTCAMRLSFKENTMQRFTAYRSNLSALVADGKVQHTEFQRNGDDEPQYEGIIWSDGTCTLRWRTAIASTSMFPSFAEMVKIHGHPEYGTRMVFHDGEPPEVWMDTLRQHGRRLETESDGALEFVEISGRLGSSAMFMREKGGGLVQKIFDGTKQ